MYVTAQMMVGSLGCHLGRMMTLFFEKLKAFCGGLATVFSGTATVKSHFSIVSYKKNEYRTALTYLSSKEYCSQAIQDDNIS